jgi:uncharacterized protein DUF5985
MMALAVYALCALTSAACAGLLLRGYLRTRSRLLLWSSAAFAAFTVNNALLFVDVVMVPERDLSVFRAALALLGVLILVVGLVWEDE